MQQDYNELGYGQIDWNAVENPGAPRVEVQQPAPSKGPGGGD